MVRSLDLLDLVWGFGLVAISIGLAQWQKLAISGQLLLAGVRSTFQLLVMGFGLQIIWQIDRPLVSIGGILLMVIATTIATSNRISDRIKLLYPIVGGAILAGLTVALGYTIFVVIKPSNWHQPQYLLAVAGISLGYLLNSTAVAGERLNSSIEQHRTEIEVRLSLGASVAESIAVYRTAAIKAAILPTIETLSISGLVTIPGFMTGELLGNVSPLNAAGYQIVIFLAVLAGNMVAAILVTGGIIGRYFNQQDQLI